MDRVAARLVRLGVRIGIQYRIRLGGKLANAGQGGDARVTCDDWEPGDHERFHPVHAKVIFEQFLSRSLLDDRPFIVAFQRPVCADETCRVEIDP